jgi:rod shape determining protein RodA
MLAFHVILNLGMNIGIMPVAGVPLPFLSYGGSSMILNLASVGLLLGIGMRKHRLSF